MAFRNEQKQLISSGDNACYRSQVRLLKHVTQVPGYRGRDKYLCSQAGEYTGSDLFTKIKLY